MGDAFMDTTKFDQELEKTKAAIDDVTAKIEASEKVLEQVADTDKLGDLNFDIENARIKDVLAQQKVMEGNIADLIIGLEDVTNSFGAEFKNMQDYTLTEKLVGMFSRNKARAMHNERVRMTSLGSNLQDLLSKSNTIVEILKNQKAVLDARYKSSEESLKRVIERRKSVQAELKKTQKRIEEINPQLLDLENKMAATTDQAARAKLEGERSKLATEYNKAQAREQELLAASQTLERYTSMFQTFVDSLNNQIAAQTTLVNKLNIDTEQRVVLYKSLEDSLKTAAQQDVAHKINTLGSKVDNAAEETMAGIGAAAQAHIADLLELHEKNMLGTKEIQRRKKLADDAFARRFAEVMEKHQSANYVS
jgi:chromosome segregation ATPase